MELIHYLTQHLFTTAQLLDRCGIDAARLGQLQQRRIMPGPSYRIRLDIGCESFFGLHTEQAALDYYSKGCATWFGQAAGLEDEAQARAIFADRYTKRLDELAASGIAPSAPSFAGVDRLNEEWNAFLDGTYGLCTVSGLPEDVAAKEASIAVIREVMEGGDVAAVGLARLRQAVDMLDGVAAPFAPHEVARSSRTRYVDEVRAAYRL
jgi:hypothetical protein